jgi:energy-coupling factor transporter transmembrane protein EcfT
MTIGPAILFITFFGKIKNAITEIIVVYGRVPFFYYILHFFLLHILCMLFFLARGHTFSEGIHKGFSMLPNFIVNNEGYSLGLVYVLWIFVVITLYPLCKWFSEYKKTHTQWWLGYL